MWKGGWDGCFGEKNGFREAFREEEETAVEEWFEMTD